METRSRRLAALSVGTAFAALLSIQGAQAGGFGVREQSAAGQGASFAGVAAGGSPASMFWNPATMTQFNGMVSEMDAALVFPKSRQTGFGTLNAFGFTGPVDNSGESALVPASYTTWQLNDRFWIGLSTNSPFGLGVGFANKAWAGAAYAESTTLRTYNAAPSIAYKVTDWLSVGAGVQIQYATANLTSFNGVGGLASPNTFLISGDGWGWGFTAGATFTPWATTQIGVGYRSQINQTIEGLLIATGGFSTPGSVKTSVKLPDIVSVGLRQGLGNGFTLLGTFEWTNWSRIGTSRITQTSGADALAASSSPITLPFQYDDGYFYAIGLEYALTPTWTVRTGFAYEQSPITDRVRTPRLPDNDRYWYSVGATNKLTDRITVDLGYSYIDVKDTAINITGPSNPWFIPGVAYTGTADSYVHILSFGAKYRWN